MSDPDDGSESSAEIAGKVLARRESAPGTHVASPRTSSIEPSEGRPLPDAIVRDIRSISGGGRALSDRNRRFFEERTDRDLSDVRVHTGREADHVATRIGARAFTIGTDIVFSRGTYQPVTSKGRQLLAHELAHVIQQTESGHRMVQRSVDPAVCEVLEYEADNGTWATILEFNALTGTIPGRGIEALRPTGARFDLNWALDVSYVAGMTGGTCSDIVGTVFGRPGVLICGGMGYISGGMSYPFARLIGAAVEGYEHGVDVGWNYFRHASLTEANVNGAEVGMLIGASGARSHATPFRAFMHTSVLEECGMIPRSPVETDTVDDK